MSKDSLNHITNSISVQDSTFTKVANTIINSNELKSSIDSLSKNVNETWFWGYLNEVSFILTTLLTLGAIYIAITHNKRNI